MLAGESSVDGGPAHVRQGHARRPARPAPAARPRPLAARLRARGLRRPARAGGAARRARARDGRGRDDGATLDAYATAQARLEHAGGYNWREGVEVTLHGLGFRDKHLDRSLATLLRRRAHPRLARAGARRRPRPAAARRADQPSGHRVAGVAGEVPAVARRRRRARRARPLVPRGGRHRGARARGRPREVLQGDLARLAAREGGA